MRGLPYHAADYFGMHYDVLEEPDRLKDAYDVAEVMWDQILDTGMSIRSRIPIDYRPAVAVCLGMRLSGVVFSFKMVATHFNLKQSSVIRYFHKVSHWKQPHWIYFEYEGELDVFGNEFQVDKGRIWIRLPLFHRFPEINMGDVLDTFSCRLGSPHLSNPAHELYLDYIDKNKGIGGRTMNVFAAALLYTVSTRNGGKVSKNMVSATLGISKRPITECCELIRKGAVC